MVPDLVGAQRSFLQFACNACCTLCIRARQQQDKLIATKTCDGVSFSDHGTQAFGDFLQQFIAHFVA